MASPDKADGYLTEIPYLFRYHRELNPAIQSLALTCRDTPGLPTGMPYNFIELGCGFGLSTLMHAATHPHVNFLGVDIMPEHIATARHMADAAKLTNIRFIEGAFADLPSHNLPTFNAIALHGVWSWINDENRAHILKFIDRHLVPGGVLYISYNALPGLAAALPLRQLMWTGFNRTPGNTQTRVDAGLALAEKLRASGALFYSANPLAAHILDDARKRDTNALAHEYFNADWWPFYHAQVADSLKPLGLRYAASGRLLENFDILNFPPAAHEQLASVQDATDLETLKDFYANREFRRDFFVRHPAPRIEGVQTLARTPFITVTGVEGIDQIVAQTPRGEIKPHRERTLAILDALTAGPKSAIELAQGPVGKIMSQAEILENLLIIAALGAAECALPAEGLEQRKANTDRLNAVLWEAAVASDAIHANVSPVTGGGVALDRVEQLFLLARHRRENPATFLKKTFKVEGDISANYAQFEEKRLPLLAKFGIVNQR